MNIKSKRIAIYMIGAAAIIATFVCFMAPIYASASLMQEESDKIDSMAREIIVKSKIPTTSAVMIQNENVQYLTYGVEPNSNTSVDESSLYQIGSLTKAYTGLAILLLEDEGLLSLDDPVTKYIPWLTFTYQGSVVKSEDFTIATLLYQTSGLTSDENTYPQASIDMSLEQGIQQLAGLELVSYPNKRYAYANANYNILGRIIEIVSKQPYEEFMTEKLLHPLELYSTYVKEEDAQKHGRIIDGAKLSFMQAHPVHIPVSKGAVPAGYFYSGAKDMSRWLQIQMGILSISPQFTRIIEKSHVPSSNSVVDADTRYAVGWFVDETNNLIYHSGGTVNYSSKVIINQQTATAACVLTNLNASVNTNDMADNIVNILNDRPTKVWQPDIWFVFDRIFTVITFASCVLILAVMIYSAVALKQMKQGQRSKGRRSRGNIIFMVASVLLCIFSITEIIILPIIFNSSWLVLAAWSPSSVLFGTVALAAGGTLMLVCNMFLGKYSKSK